ncbi:M28 family metallopeptidase [Deinococcus sp. MIMF12]|uniref:M28 family metallopeptidase n=1 Tax=Deinococcus rhizophilus TaxID=3049544 RepID=A0ABT7JER1_9DEIO|nr:M28 family metallopeptidase [Deinococcus rhizophilus]MDL2343544.1 M28 family metallopeptidase [Deinococcus rhizophilus]
MPRRALPTRPSRPLWSWALPLLAAAGLVGGGVYLGTRPQNPPLQEAAQARTVAGDWAGLRAFGPRPVGEPGHTRALDWLAGQLESLGYRVTRQPVTLERPFDQGGTLTVGGLRVPAHALYGAQGGEQSGRLVPLPGGLSKGEMEARGLRGQIALLRCQDWDGDLSRGEIVGRATLAGALGLVWVQDCAVARVERVAATVLPLVWVSAQDGERVWARAGEEAELVSKVERREVTGANLIAARVDAEPGVVVGAHLDSVNASPGANDNASGVLAVLEAARRAAGTPLAERTWFVLFDGEEDGLYGSRAFVDAHRFALRQTRAMLNLDMVGVGAEALGVAAHAELRPLARAVRPGIRLFEDDPPERESFGRTSGVTGSSDHVPFIGWGVRTAFVHRGVDRHYHAASDRTLSPALVTDAAAFALALARKALDAPWTPQEPCEGFRSEGC